MIKNNTFLCSGFVLFLFSVLSISSAESLENLQDRFINLPHEARSLTGPLFWLHGDESSELLEEYVAKVAQGGNGCFTAESRPHNDWLGEGWYRDLGICLEAAKKNKLKMWIFDEKWWPSGEVGGKVPQKYGSKYMQTEALEVQGGKTVVHPVNSDRLIAVLAGKVTDSQRVQGDTLIDLTGKVQDSSFTWQAPDGLWQIMFFTWDYSKGHRILVDGASKEAVDWLIATVYQPHYDHFQDDFGTVIPGFFYDEPETEGDWGTEVIPMLKARGVDWKKALVAWKFALTDEQQAAARYQYQDAFAEAWGKTLFGGITRWCHEHKVRSIGHFLEHSGLYLHPRVCAGNMFQLQKYSDMGAIDAVFAQFIMGDRNRNDYATWQTPKLGSSISHVYGKPDDIAMVEIFGARGQDLTYPEMKWWTNHMQVSGINFHIPHSFNPRSPHDTDCPPYFYNNGNEPRWPLYRVYADYTSRLSAMLTGGRHVCPVALLFVGNSVHVGKAVRPEQISEALQDSLYDCDWMPYDVFENDTRIAAGRLNLYNEKYRVLIVPPVEYIPAATLAKARSFFDNGGIVIGYDFLPSGATDLDKGQNDIIALNTAIWGDAAPSLAVCKVNAAGGRSYLLPASPTAQQIRQVLSEDARLDPTLKVLAGTTDDWLHVLHRVKDDRDVFFICNQNIDGGVRNFKLQITADGFPECWDPMSAEINTIPFTRSGDKVELVLPLAPLQTTLLVFAPEQRHLPQLIGTGSVRPVGSLAIKALPMEKTDIELVATDISLADRIKNCSWCWCDNGSQPGSSAPAGTVCFRKTFTIPAECAVVSAEFVGTADNAMALYVNGKAVAVDDSSLADWRKLSQLDISDALVPGVNTIAISVENTTNEPSPAGLIGNFILAFDNGSIQTVAVDSSWKATSHRQASWHTVGFDDSSWQEALAFAVYGNSPWGRLDNRNLTVSPVEKATVYNGEFDCPTAIAAGEKRVVLQMAGIAPEAAARITVNGIYIGGCIGEPLRKDISQFVTPGINTVRIEPFTPDTISIDLYPSASD
ncbi:MAG: hypothetical protein JW745_09030 [Sedimentisphaerales bacterium]|nr:hypothetical protein [Sedimentisphaerales bacterium]MBN2843456.1 hypothetical protein [Sedimentisphaerales bacterium]